MWVLSAVPVLQWGAVQMFANGLLNDAQGVNGEIAVLAFA
jgi:hypothetical protein